MLINETIEIELNGKKVKHYESLGYDIPKKKDKNYRMTVPKGTKLLVKIDDLPSKSHELVPYQCDYCLEKGLKPYKDIARGRKIVNKDCCENCIPLKKRDISLIKHGVEHTTQLESTKIKMRETNLKVRGFEYPSQSPEVREKVVSTFLDKYGETNPMKNEVVKDKIRLTNIKRYGTPSPLQNEDIKNKAMQTYLIRYGVDNPQKNKEIREKTMKTMNERGRIATSLQQRYIHSLIGGEINYLFNTSILDIALLEEKIYVEYDGSGHWLSIVHGELTEKEFELKEIKRSYAMQSKGWKEIRIISKKDKIPSDEKIFEMIEFAKEYLNKGRHYIKFDIDEEMVRTSQFEKPYDFGKLRKVKKQDDLMTKIN
ncbi:DUF7487 domain-containing protein [Metabacillus sp. Hm71]|uniref:DUF7487 domain-containing protein n=1 Tax=Metabacillus sp. Hm71 TaxID=3450743 RepID=UPI003F434CFA